MRDRLCSRVASPSGREQAAPLRPIDLPAVREEEDPHPVEGRSTGREFERVSRSFWALFERVFEQLARPTMGAEVAIENERRNEL